MKAVQAGCSGEISLARLSGTSMKLYNSRDSQKDECMDQGRPISKPETEIGHAPMINSVSIGIRVGDLHVLGLLRSLVSHGLVLLTNSVHVDGSRSLLDLWEGAAGPGG